MREGSRMRAERYGARRGRGGGGRGGSAVDDADATEAPPRDAAAVPTEANEIEGEACIWLCEFAGAMESREALARGLVVGEGDAEVDAVGSGTGPRNGRAPRKAGGLPYTAWSVSGGGEATLGAPTLRAQSGVVGALAAGWRRVDVWSAG